jgi:hypothetical protein
MPKMLLEAGCPLTINKQQKWIQDTFADGKGVFVVVRSDQSKYESNNGIRAQYFSGIHTFAATSYADGMKQWSNMPLLEANRDGQENFERVSHFQFMPPP